MKDGTHCSSLHRFEGGGSSLPHHPFHCSHPYSSSGLSVCSSTLDWRVDPPMGSLLPPPRHIPTSQYWSPQKIEFSPPVPPLLTQHYKVWRSVHSLLLVESDKGGVAGGTGSTGEWVGVTSDLRRQLKRCMENIRGCWRRWRRSDPRQRALRHPPFIPPLPHPQSLRRPCLRGRRGSSTIANGSAAEWWRGVMKPITTPINRALKGILSDRLKPARWMCAHTKGIGQQWFPGNLEEEGVLLFAGWWFFSSAD